MGKSFYTGCLFLLFFCFIPSGTAKKRWGTNVYESSISRVTLNLKGADTKEEICNRLHRVLKGNEKWCDAFIEQCPGKPYGLFTFKDKKRVVGIGYDVTAVKARRKANKNNLTALEKSNLNKLGAYSTVLKLQTKNGYFIFAIMRSPVDEGFRLEDFNNKSEDILKDMDDNKE